MAGRARGWGGGNRPRHRIRHGSGSAPQVNFLPGAQITLSISVTYPHGVAVDGSGNVYIADTQNSQVLKETLSAGTYIQSTSSAA